MSNNNEEHEIKQLSATSQSEPVDRSPEKQHHESHKNSHWFNGVSCVMAILALIIGLYTIYFNDKSLKQLSNDTNRLATELNQLKQTDSYTKEHVDTQTENIRNNQAELQKKLDHLNQQLQTAMDQRLYQNQDWLLLKARYYLEMAQINSHWSDNYNTSIALLQEADKILKPLNAAKILNVRQLIAQEITQLKAAPTVDIAGSLSQLDAAQFNVSNLTMPSTPPVDQSAAQTSSSDTPTWRKRLQDSVSVLEKLVVVRRNDEEIKPLMSPLFESLLRESIRLNLQEAQWAILNNNATVYELALKQAIETIKRTFNGESKQSATLIKQLNELQQVKLDQEKPVVGLALPIINQLIDNNELLGKPGANKGENQ